MISLVISFVTPFVTILFFMCKANRRKHLSVRFLFASCVYQPHSTWPHSSICLSIIEIFSYINWERPLTCLGKMFGILTSYHFQSKWCSKYYQRSEIVNNA